ncbi:MAG TPA: hypothetical protein VFM98_14105 [Ramlibacter sp.]|uniref:hypothetical protein n=1 Tax=Ramlibacter sp. TaxID=1917967 RepID=UPI002D7E54FC|nr:hypothetical protein [Ramlibacter sp.]HET8746736.1 hypothetical protein [Ramlibacter sp.]
MRTTPCGGRELAGSDFFVDFGAGPAWGRLPLRQDWQLPSSVAPALQRTLRCEGGDPPRFAIVRRGREGEIWALNERALGEGRHAMKLAHLGAVRFTEPRVHTYLHPQRRVPMEPLMAVKVNARREHMEPILAELRTRGARMQEVELQGRRVTVRAEARLAALLGFEQAIDALTAHSGQAHTWLARYEAAPALTARTSKEEEWKDCT